jgi:hypothetical protein
MAKTRSTGKRITGGSVSGSAFGFGGGVGASVAATTTDRDIVQALVTFLEDRRVLFNPEYLEVEVQVASSVVQIRRELTEALQQLDPKSPAVSSISMMRAACRRFLDHPRQYFRHFEGPRHSHDDLVPGFFLALGELRATFGAELQRLDKQFKLRIEVQLRDLFPGEDRF